MLDRFTDPQWGDRVSTLAVIADSFSFAAATGSHLPDISNSVHHEIVFMTLWIKKEQQQWT